MPDMKWIPVTERLPEKDVYVLAFDGTWIFVSMYYEFQLWDDIPGVMRWRTAHQHAPNPTHWMPLPEPPKEVE